MMAEADLDGDGNINYQGFIYEYFCIYFFNS